jgi:hypothetical protein
MAKTATASAPHFASVLDTPVGDIERPKPLPPGQYVCVVQGQPRIDKSAKKQTEFSEYTLKLLEAMDTVDEEALTTYLTNKDGSKKRLQDVTTKVTFYHTENSVYRLKDFLRHCGLDIDDAESEGTSLRQLIAEVPGRQVIATITHEASQRGDGVYATVSDTAPVEG